MTTQQDTAAKIAGRQQYIRRWLNSERHFLPYTSCLGDVGKYAEHRFYRFGQLALFRDGRLLENDTNWATVKKELDDWPMTLWLNLLDVDTTINEAKAVYNSMTNGRFTVTMPSDEDDTRRPFKLVQMGWVHRNIRSATRLKIWQWLGTIGGEYPPIPDDQGD